LDRNGNLAAGTSTGGTNLKEFGRVGDSPIIGAGTYASNATCAVSATGVGEIFIRRVAAYDIAAQVEYKGIPLHEAASGTLARIAKTGGVGGFIAINASGEVVTISNTPGMFRGFRLSDGSGAVKIYPGED
jgi:beta-aspartyl-peptidase (threonine type)